MPFLATEFVYGGLLLKFLRRIAIGRIRERRLLFLRNDYIITRTLHTVDTSVFCFNKPKTAVNIKRFEVAVFCCEGTKIIS